MLPTTFVTRDWHISTQGREVMNSLVQRNTQKRKTFGLLEKPSLPPQLSPEEFQYKVFVSGKAGVGKTSTVARLTGHDIPTTYCETPGIQTNVLYWPAKLVDIDKTVMFSLQFWDAGENSIRKFDHVLPACKESADAILFLFSFVDKSSFDDIPRQMSRILEPGDTVCRFIMGTKIDQHAQSEVTQRDIRDFQQQWKLPILTIRNITENSQSDPRAEINEIAPVLNYMCDQLWLRDQILAGKVENVDESNLQISQC